MMKSIHVLLIKFFGHFVAFSSLAGLIFSIVPVKDMNPLTWIALLISAVATLAVFGSDIQHWMRHTPLLFNSDEEGHAKIRKYMRQWISREGEVAIWSKDLTWATADQTVKDVLFNKARAKQLTLFVPTQFELSQALQAEGAKVISYHEIGYTPKSRFTFVQVGRATSRVAIASSSQNQHRIDEFSAGDGPEFHLAEDLMEIVRRFKHG
jgi:hypothetical protein